MQTPVVVIQIQEVVPQEIQARRLPGVAVIMAQARVRGLEVELALVPVREAVRARVQGLEVVRVQVMVPAQVAIMAQAAVREIRVGTKGIQTMVAVTAIMEITVATIMAVTVMAAIPAMVAAGIQVVL